jgi:hypothetical protein
MMRESTQTPLTSPYVADLSQRIVQRDEPVAAPARIMV